MFETGHPIKKMHCIQNKIHCGGCKNSYIPNAYPNLLKSQGHINDVVKKHCCSCNTALTEDRLCYNNHDLTCCISSLSLKSNDNIKIVFRINKIVQLYYLIFKTTLILFFDKIFPKVS